MELNAEQKIASIHPVGEPALLMAGAGSGKTSTLTQRIIHLIKNEGVLPKRILALTFTNRAAREIVERVLKALPDVEEHAGPRLTTIHSLALSMIRRNPPAFGLPPKITPIDDYDQSQLLKRIIAREKIEDVNLYKLVEQMEYHRSQGVGFAVDYTDEVHEEAKKKFGGAHALRPLDITVWKEYEDEKALGGLVDFSDMLHLSIRRQKTDQAWREALWKVYDHVIMDEAQDTSPTSWTFTTMLLGPENRNMLIITDLTQSIYSFNGSKPQLILDYMEGWRGVVPRVYQLVRNHRSCPEIVKLANKIQILTEMPSLQMASHRGEQGEKGKTLVLRGDDPYGIASSIAKRILTGGRPYKDYAILMRAGSQLREIEGELIKARIPYVVRGGHSLLQTEEVKDILAYVRFASNTRDYAALMRSMGAPTRGVGPAKLEQIRKVAMDQYNGDLYQACKAAGAITAPYVDTIRMIQMSIDNPLQAVHAAITSSGYTTHLKKKYAKDQSKIDTKLDNLLRLKEMVRGLMDATELTAEDLIFQLTMEKPEKESPEGSVTISTIHAAKGLEWPVVAVFSVVENQMPHKFSLKEGGIAEERRVWYVAATRARDELWICVPDQVNNGKYMCPAKPSRFLVELGIFPAQAE
jgi:superfamily I DNA/RNA helicase